MRAGRSWSHAGISHRAFLTAHPGAKRTTKRSSALCVDVHENCKQRDDANYQSDKGKASVQGALGAQRPEEEESSP